MKSVDDAARAILDIATRDQAEQVQVLPEAEPMKVCSKCGPTKGPKPLDAFDKHPNCRDGYHTICKQCRADHSKEMRRQKNEAKSGTKLCIKCGPEKGPLPIAKFYRNGGTKDGRDTTCKDCLLEAAKAKRIAKRGYEYKCPQCGAEHSGRPTAKGLSRICSNCEPPEEVKTMPIDEEKIDSTYSVSLMLDELFDGYPEIRTRIEEQAKEQFRTSKLQVLYLVNRAMTST